MRMAWYKVYTYIILPLGIMSFIIGLTNLSFSFHSFFIKVNPYPAAIPEFIFTTIAVSTIILNLKVLPSVTALTLGGR